MKVKILEWKKYQKVFIIILNFIFRINVLGKLEIIPYYFLQIKELYNIDIIIEAKFKEKAIHKLFEKYP